MRPAPPPPLLGRLPPHAHPTRHLQAQPELSLDPGHGSIPSNMPSHGIQPTDQQLSLYGPSSSPQTQPSRSTSTPSNELSDEDALSSDLSDCPDEEEDDDWSPRNRSTAGKKGAPRRNQGRHSSSKGDGTRHRWTKSEDRVIIAAVKKHGQSWTAVKADLDRLGGHPRRNNAIIKRYRRLVDHSARKRGALEAAAAASSSSLSASALQQHRQSVSSAYIPTDLEWNPRFNEPWSREEKLKLEALAMSDMRFTDIFAAFVKHFPSTMRTRAAVEMKCRPFRRAKNATDDHMGAGNSISTSSSAQGSVTASSLPPTEGSQGATLSNNSALVPPKRGRGRPRKTPLASAAPTLSTLPSSLCKIAQAANESHCQLDGYAATPSDFDVSNYNAATPVSPAAAVGNDEAVDFAFQARSPPPPLAQQPLPPSSVTDYTVTVTGTGLLVENLPPLHQLLILSPVSYRVIGPRQDTSASVSSHLNAPFVFQAGMDGSIQALVLPPGTTSSIALLPAEPRVGERGQAAQPRSLIERRFVTVDEFTVVFQSTPPSV